MGCGDGSLIRASEPRLLIPLRRIVDAPATDQAQLQVAAHLTPVVVVADLSHSVGALGWRGIWDRATSAAVVGRRSVFVIGAAGGAFRVEYLQTLNDMQMSVLGFAALDALLANAADVANVMVNTSGAREGGASSIRFQTADIDGAALPSAGIDVNNPGATESFPYPNYGFKPEIPKGSGILIWGVADNTAQSIQLAVTEYKDWA